MSPIESFALLTEAYEVQVYVETVNKNNTPTSLPSKTSFPCLDLLAIASVHKPIHVCQHMAADPNMC